MPAPARTTVKVCGLTRLDDAREALAAGADWLGFIVHGESPRRVEPELAGAIAAALPDATIVAVMVSPTPAEAADIARRAGASRVQLHRVEATTWPAAFALPVTFAIGVTEQGTLKGTLPAEPALALLDTAAGDVAGGTGRTFPWQIAAAISGVRPIVLAGGLGPDNVEEAIERVQPWGVDACSRLETSPGIKDLERVRAFVSAVRRADARRGA